MKNKNLFWGIFFLLAALFVIASQTASFKQIGGVSILATILLIALIIRSLLNKSFLGVFVPMALIYMIYQHQLGLTYISPWMLILAAILAQIGFSYLFFGGCHKVKHPHCGSECFKSDSQNMDDNNPYAELSFGSSSKYLHSDCLKSGQFSTSFGSMEVFFSEAQLSPEGAEIFLKCSFGTIKLYIPKQWRVVDNLHVSVGNVESSVRTVLPEDNAPQLTITGNVQWANVEIIYI